MTLTDNGEPTSEDGNNDTNLTVDFGFVAGGPWPRHRCTTTATPRTSSPARPPGDYNTTALDTGAVHSWG